MFVLNFEKHLLSFLFLRRKTVINRINQSYFVSLITMSVCWATLFGILGFIFLIKLTFHASSFFKTDIFLDGLSRSIILVAVYFFMAVDIFVKMSSPALNHSLGLSPVNPGIVITPSGRTKKHLLAGGLGHWVNLKLSWRNMLAAGSVIAALLSQLETLTH